MRNVKVVQVSKSQAQQMSKEVIAHWKTMETGWFELGRLIDECFKKRVPQVLGMTAKQWMEKCIPGSISKGFRALRITRALGELPESDRKQITEGNAVRLAGLSPKDRKAKGWIEKAKEMPNEEFAAEIAHYKQKRFGIKPEEFITLRLSMPRAVFDQFEAAIQKIALACGIDLLGNEGRRIEVYERMASVINGCDDGELKNFLEGE